MRWVKMGLEDEIYVWYVMMHGYKLHIYVATNVMVDRVACRTDPHVTATRMTCLRVACMWPQHIHGRHC